MIEYFDTEEEMEDSFEGLMELQYKHQFLKEEIKEAENSVEYYKNDLENARVDLEWAKKNDQILDEYEGQLGIAEQELKDAKETLNQAIRDLEDFQEEHGGDLFT